MTKIKSILKGAKNLAFAAFLAGGLWLNGCDNPVCPPEPPIPQKLIPSIFQTAELENFVNIKYNAKIKDLKEATLTVLRDGNPVAFRMITDSIYSETLSYSTNKDITKGNYVFTLAGKNLDGRDTSIAGNLSVPTYPFTISLNKLNFDEDSDTTEVLPNPTYINPEDNPATWTNVANLDGKINPQLNGLELTVKNNTNQVGDYSLKLNVKSNTGRNDVVIKDGCINNLLDVEGVLEDNEQHLRQSGTIKVYDGKIEQATGKNRMLGEIDINSTGQFNKRFNSRINDLVDYILVQGRKIENGENKSYVRTMKLPRTDAKGLTVRVVPYDGLAENGISVEDFGKFMLEVTENPLDIYGVIIKNILFKWDFGEFNSPYPFKEIIISKQASDSTINKYFSQATAENIKSRILDKNDIGAWFRGKIINPNKIRIVESYTFDFNSPSNYGRLVVYPSNYNGSGFQDINNDGYIDIGQIDIDVNSNGELISQGALTHEFGHGSGLNGHAITLPQEKTIMRAFLLNLNYSIPRFADKKTANAIYEDTYKHGQGKMMINNLLGLDYILALKWADE